MAYEHEKSGTTVSLDIVRHLIVPQWEENPRLQAKTSVQSGASNAVRHRAARGRV
jgi:hypothetical protein